MIWSCTISGFDCILPHLWWLSVLAYWFLFWCAKKVKWDYRGMIILSLEKKIYIPEIPKLFNAREKRGVTLSITPKICAIFKMTIHNHSSYGIPILAGVLPENSKVSSRIPKSSINHFVSSKTYWKVALHTKYEPLKIPLTSRKSPMIFRFCSLIDNCILAVPKIVPEPISFGPINHASRCSSIPY